MATTPTLTCKQCNFANEPERVYCHNCGAKLDRSLLPKEPPKAAQDSREKDLKRVRKLVNPNRGFFTNWHRALLSSLAASISIAAIVQICRPPAAVPPVPTRDQILSTTPLLEQIQDAQMTPASTTYRLTPQMINIYLADAVKPGADTADDYFKFDRMFVNLGKDEIRVTAELSAFGHPIYAGSTYKLSVAGGKLVSTNVGGNLGRLLVHPMIMTYCAPAFQKLWDALTRERDVMDKMQNVSIQPDGFTFVTKPHG